MRAPARPTLSSPTAQAQRPMELTRRPSLHASRSCGRNPPADCHGRLTVDGQKLKEKEKGEITARQRAPVFRNPARLRECPRSAARAFEIPRKPRAAARD